MTKALAATLTISVAFSTLAAGQTLGQRVCPVWSQRVEAASKEFSKHTKLLTVKGRSVQPLIDSTGGPEKAVAYVEGLLRDYKAELANPRGNLPTITLRTGLEYHEALLEILQCWNAEARHLSTDTNPQPTDANDRPPYQQAISAPPSIQGRASVRDAAAGPIVNATTRSSTTAVEAAWRPPEAIINPMNSEHPVKFTLIDSRGEVLVTMNIWIGEGTVRDGEWTGGVLGADVHNESTTCSFFADGALYHSGDPIKFLGGLGAGKKLAPKQTVTGRGELGALRYSGEFSFRPADPRVSLICPTPQR